MAQDRSTIAHPQQHFWPGAEGRGAYMLLTPALISKESYPLPLLLYSYTVKCMLNNANYTSNNTHARVQGSSVCVFLCQLAACRPACVQVMAILGPSGSGKSSLLNVLAGNVSHGPQYNIQGRVCMDERAVHGSTLRRLVGHVPQFDLAMR